MCVISGDFITINYKAYLIYYKVYSLCNVNDRDTWHRAPFLILQCDSYVLGTFSLFLTFHTTVKTLPASGLDKKQYFEKPEDGTNF